MQLYILIKMVFILNILDLRIHSAYVLSSNGYEKGTSVHSLLSAYTS